MLELHKLRLDLEANSRRRISPSEKRLTPHALLRTLPRRSCKPGTQSARQNRSITGNSLK